MKPGLAIGATGDHRMVVAPHHTVRALFGDLDAFPAMPEVFATAYMTGLMEWACVELIRPFYEAGEDSLGTHVDFSHVAPTLPGQTVTVTATVEAIDGRAIWFAVSAHDGVDLIGEGRHQRALVRWEKFVPRAMAKAEKAVA